jgi:hypothetical protein
LFAALEAVGAKLDIASLVGSATEMVEKQPQHGTLRTQVMGQMPNLFTSLTKKAADLSVVEAVGAGLLSATQTIQA